ncbi:dephospho-CoA kinase [Horticoccus luteus]|uniref:Dephospho-CoA kinase n=1 Tax=Horticoccus luteus TaxID=2862869 RepID=A0A8F9TZU9_9BACT|nr:dephospho-CoA kinase [Horticoccus luteus]QYM80552.1 dephospho-CoA kinase [Horticoccus luteus]
MILGITGGMGCGKSTVARLCEQRGLRRLDSDALIRERVLTDPAMREALRAEWGADVAPVDAPVNRARLAARVFDDEMALATLERLTHPPLFALWRAALRDAPTVDWAIEVPLLFEKGLENWFDFTVCVASSPAQQLARLEQRGLSRALAEQRISKQLSLARKIELSDHVVWNDGSLAFLESQVDHLLAALRTLR